MYYVEYLIGTMGGIDLGMVVVGCCDDVVDMLVL